MQTARARMSIALLALIVPAAGVAQRGPRGPMGPGGVAPLERLLELADELHLTQEQQTRLRSIRSDLEERNRPHLERIAAIRAELGLPEPRDRDGARPERPRDGERRRPTDEERDKMREFVDRARDDLRAVADNGRDAMDEVRDVLTDEQRGSLRERMEARRGERDRHGPRRGRGPRS